MFQFLVALYFLIIPFQWALSPAAGVDLAVIRLFTLLLILSWLLISLLRKKLVLPSSLPSFFVTCFLFLSTLSFFWAQDRDFSLRKILFLWSFLPLYFVLSSLFQEAKENTKKSFSFFVMGGFLVALVALFQFISQFIFGVEKMFSLWTGQVLPLFLGSTFSQSVVNYPSLLVNISGNTLMRASGLFPDPHMFSFYMGLLIPVSLGMFLTSEKGQRLVFGCIFLTLLIADLLSFSRGGYMGLFSGLIFFSGLYFFDRLLSVRKVLSGLTLVVFVILLVSVSPVGSRFISTFSLSDGSNSERLRLWGEAIEHIEERPFLGVGLGNYPLSVKPTTEYREPIYAHNLYLDIAVEIGILGLVFFLGLLLSVAFEQWKLWRNKKSIFALSLLTALVIFSTHAFFETPLFSVHVLPALLLILAGGVL